MSDLAEREPILRENLPEFPLVSIIISNYNYKNYLEGAIGSALNQTYSDVEVIVVDDGSTDGSRQLIASYGDRIVVVLKENGGQASACNAGYRVSQGEVVIFLDADDMLLPDAVERVIAGFGSRPGVAKVQYRLRIIDANGRPTGELTPPARLRMHSGDLRQHLIDVNGYVWPSTSGNAFAAAVLRQIMPIPEALCRGMPDIHLCNLSPVFGEVVTLEEPAGLYRVHGRNNYYDPTGSVDLDKLRMILLANEDNHMRKKALFSALYSVDTHTIGPRDMYSLRGRMISLKLDPKKHPFKDSLWKLFVRGCLLSLSYPDPLTSKRRRFLYLLFFCAMLLSPRFLARFPARTLFSEQRGWFYNRITSILGRT